jgi:NAD(P)-dependent dehydrogenase (short-subunit alcohol dehydrogenase family)
MTAAHTPNATKVATKVVLVTGASSGFGALTVRALADAGHSVHAGMRATTGHNAAAAQDAAEYGTTTAGELHPVDLDVTDQDSVDRAVAHVLQRAGHIDVVVHNAGHMVLGPTEAFTPDQLAATYDVNVISTQRVNRAVLPHLRSRRRGLLVWIGSSSTSVHRLRRRRSRQQGRDRPTSQTLQDALDPTRRHPHPHPALPTIQRPVGRDLDTTPQPDPGHRPRPVRNLIMATHKSVVHPPALPGVLCRWWLVASG